MISLEAFTGSRQWSLEWEDPCCVDQPGKWRRHRALSCNQLLGAGPGLQRLSGRGAGVIFIIQRSISQNTTSNKHRYAASYWRKFLQTLDLLLSAWSCKLWEWSMIYTLALAFLTLNLVLSCCFWSCLLSCPPILWDLSFPCDSFLIEGSHFLQVITYHQWNTEQGLH